MSLVVEVVVVCWVLLVVWCAVCVVRSVLFTDCGFLCVVCCLPFGMRRCCSLLFVVCVVLCVGCSFVLFVVLFGVVGGCSLVVV